jgi:hypothetical protein
VALKSRHYLSSKAKRKWQLPPIEENVMSYHISILHKDTHSTWIRNTNQAVQLDEIVYEPLEPQDVERFLERLVKYRYQLELQTPEYQEFVRHIGKTPITVRIFATEIGFTVPYWGNDEAIFEALQDASELSDSETLVLYNPQTGEWTI